jgi:hypothetical protein
MENQVLAYDMEIKVPVNDMEIQVISLSLARTLISMS